MSIPKYSIGLVWSSEDRAWLAQVPELPGCIADGATQEEALSNARLRIAEWVETAQDLGRKVPAALDYKAMEKANRSKLEAVIGSAIQTQIDRIIPQILAQLAGQGFNASVGTPSISVRFPDTARKTPSHRGAALAH